MGNEVESGQGEWGCKGVGELAALTRAVKVSLSGKLIF